MLLEQISNINNMYFFLKKKAQSMNKTSWLELMFITVQ
jgi:hypothetical protein